MLLLHPAMSKGAAPHGSDVRIEADCFKAGHASLPKEFVVLHKLYGKCAAPWPGAGIGIYGFLMMRFAPLGLKLMRKGKLPLQLPSRGKGKLAAIYQKIEEIEG